MVKVHRMHRHNWWRTSKEITPRDCQAMRNFWLAGISFSVLAEHFGCSVEYAEKMVNQRTWLQSNTATEDARSKWTVQEIRDYLSPCTKAPFRRDDDEKIVGIPPGVDVLDWYLAWAKMKKGEVPAEGRTTKKEETKEYYAEVLYQIYRSSGYSIEDSVHVKYTPHGQEIMRYLAKTARVEAERYEQDAMNG